MDNTEMFEGFGKQLRSNHKAYEMSSLKTAIESASYAGKHAIVWDAATISLELVDALEREGIKVISRSEGGYVVDWLNAYEEEA